MTPRLRNFSLYLLLPLATVAVALGLLTHWLVATESGSGWAVRRAVEAVPALSVDRIGGTLGGGLTLKGVTWRQAELEVSIAAVAGQWRLSSLLDGQFSIDRLVVDRPAITATGVASPPSPPGPWPSLALPFPLRVNGEIRDLTWQPAATEGDAPAATRLQRIRLRALISPFQYQIQELRAASDLGTATLSGRIASAFPYRHQLQLAWSLVGTDELQGEASLAGDLRRTALQHRLLKPLPVVSEGVLGLDNRAALMDLDPSRLHLELTTRWQALILALGGNTLASTGALELVAEQGRYRLAAEVDLAPSSGEPRWMVPLEREVAIPDGAWPLKLAMDGEGDLAGLEQVTADIATGAGSARLTGALAWADGLRWRLAADARQLNLAPFLPDWPAVLSGEIRSSGEQAAAGLSATLVADNITGTLRHQDLQLQVNAAMAPEEIRVDKLQLVLADNRLSAEGTLAADSDLRWQLDAPRLTALAPGLAGALRGEGRFTGSLDNPRLTATLAGDKLALADWSLAGVNLRAEAAGVAQLALTADLTTLAGPGLPATDAQVRGEGALADHRLTLAVTNPQLTASLGLQGGYGDEQWRGRLRQLALAAGDLPAIQQTGSAAVVAGASGAALEDLCLAGAGELCVDAGYGPDGLTLAGRLSRLPLAILKPWLPETLALAGVVDGQVDVRRDGSGQRGAFSLSTADGEVIQGGEEGDPLRLPAALQLSGNLRDQRLDASGDLALDDTARLALSLTMGLAGDQAMSGKMTAAVDSLDWLTAFTGAIVEPAGQLRGRFDLSGTPQAPRVAGSLALTGFSGAIAATGVPLADGSANLVLASGGDWRLQGRVATPDGAATVVGGGATADLLAGNLAVDVLGDNLTLMDLPDVRINVSPELRLTADGDGLKVTGTLTVPKADIQVRTLPEGAVSPSADEVITPPLAEPVGAGSTRVDLRLVLGDAVRIRGYGLDSHLAGNLRLRYSSGGPTTARGRIELRKGTYEAYGQKLKITRGHLIFQGNPENPGLNIVAVRETDSAEVGLRISGAVQQIDSEVFSDPALPPSEAFILLITGKPPNNLSEADANLVMNAATALGIAQSDWLTTKLQKSFGLDKLGLESGDTYEGSSLVVGKQLTPKLFISYVQNLFSPTSSFVLQYQLGRNFGLKAESGEFHSIDLNYRVEH